MTEKKVATEWPDILQRYVDEVKPDPVGMPHPVIRRFHGRDVPLWQGYVHIDDIEGYVENLRLRFYLNRWKARQEEAREPTTDDIYDIMVEADKEERRESRRPFHVERIADSIVRNNIREPIILGYLGDSRAELWDGNRRFYGAKHVMKAENNGYEAARPRVQWLPAYVYVPSGDPEADKSIKHDILVECNFVEPEQIPWPAYVKAEQVYNEYERRMSVDPDDPVLSREVKVELAKAFGLKGWRTADRWIKMYDLALQWKEYQEEEKEQDPTMVDLLIQERFEYFDELSKPGVFGVISRDPDMRDEVFDWMWDGKFKAWTDVRMVPRILADPVARKQANESHENAVKDAIATVIANDPIRVKDKTAANEKIKQFAAWLDSFKREDYKRVDAEGLEALQVILRDVTKITAALLASEDTEEEAVAAGEALRGTE